MRAKQYRQIRSCPAVDDATAESTSGREELLPILQRVQSINDHLSRSSLGATADRLGLSDAQVFGVATFYSMMSTEPRPHNVIRMCDGPVCTFLGGQAAYDAVAAVTTDADVCLERTSCLGTCDRAPAALVNRTACGPVVPATAARILGGSSDTPPDYSRPRPGEIRIAMARIGVIDPDDLSSAINAGAYQALGHALRDEASALLASVSESGLQGRGGAGFPTGKKWHMVASAPGQEKYIVCNADESEPCVFKDRVLLEGDPHLVLEGMALAGLATGARQGVIYIRGEYDLAAERMERAIQQAEDRNWLGRDIQGTGFDFHVAVHRGAGAYICGEETALLESLEGARGEPRVRPPYPTSCGFRGKPTVVNNVETLCKVPFITQRGADWYRSMGTSHSPGTKLFAVTGHICQPGLFEAPFGITLRQIIDEFAGGMREGSSFKMALTGGAAGTIVGRDALDVPLDYRSHEDGVSLGAGSVFVLDETASVITLLQSLLHFFELESCGKCTPCREGTRAARHLLDNWKHDKAKRYSVDRLRQLSNMLQRTSLCGLGQSVAWPINSALANFPEEFA